MDSVQGFMRVRRQKRFRARGTASFAKCCNANSPVIPRECPGCFFCFAGARHRRTAVPSGGPARSKMRGDACSCIFPDAQENLLQFSAYSAIIKCASVRSIHMERYRSGHNGADSKSVWRQRHVGSNPTRSAKCKKPSPSGEGFLFLMKDSNGSGSEWRAGGTSEPRPGLHRSAGRIPPAPP